MARMLFRIVNPSLVRRQPRSNGNPSGRPVSVASALVRADQSPELAVWLGQFALQFLH